MPDIPASTTTTQSITVGGTFSNSLEVAGDHDWVRVQLTAGQQVSVELDGITLADPFLTIRSSTGAIIFQDDDSGPGLNSLIAFAAPSTGTYYLDLGAAGDTGTGTYQLSVTPYVLPPLGTTDEMADWLVNGFWNGDSHHFPVTQGGTITVNLTALTAEGQSFAREALGIWSDIIGVHFQEVSTTAQITFDDLDQSTGAFTDGNWANGITSSMNVNVSAQRLGAGTGLIREGLTTYLHEIGHALGLGHNGDYNGGTAFSRYPYQARYLNDSLAVSIMSYFDNGENSYYANQGFSNALVVTPQIADIDAVAMLYGLSTTTRTGDTTYGFHNTSGRTEFDASLHPFVAYTVFDSGGNDTLDYSGFANPQLINLNPETFSNVGGLVGNVSIARGTVIENAVGGSGNDQIIGNAADDVLTGGGGKDTLTGGAGTDVFQDTAAGLNGDTITDLTAGDRIVITDAAPNGFTFSLGGNTLTYTGGSLTLSTIPAGHFIASAAAAGGVQLALVTRDVANDFNGDSRSDLLWRSDTGELTDWLGSATGALSSNAANAYTIVPASWQIAGAADVNGDGRDDIIWRNDDGRITDWLANANGGFAASTTFSTTVATSWHVAGTGDFNGDGKDDILWRNDNGTITDWLANTSGGFTASTTFSTTVATSWHVVGTADFNGDGRDDILWRNDNGQLTDWLRTDTGGFVSNVFSVFVPTNWTVAATGDFNGDGYSDILWRSDTGQMTDWLGSSAGTLSSNAAASAFVPTNWQVVEVGDFNGDGRDDILWRSDTGNLTQWLGTDAGAFSDNSANAATFVATSWHVEDAHAHGLFA